MQDLFETPELLPANVRAIVNRYAEKLNNGDGDGYTVCAELVAELELNGYTCDYYLDAEPYDLKKLNSYSYKLAPGQDQVIIYYNGKPVGTYTPNEPIDNDSAQAHIQALFNAQK